MANGGKLYQLDDTSVGADKYDAAGPTSTSFDATLTMSPFTLGPGTYGSLRKFVLDVDTGAALSLVAQGIRDGDVSGALLTRAVAVADPPDQIVPLKVMGTAFQMTLILTGWAAATTPAASLGAASVTIVPRRGSRGGSET